jgi:FkbM family methyltransferase
MTRPTANVNDFEPDLARRVALTVSGTDSDDIPKVAGAGEDRVVNGDRVQVMHNGMIVEYGGYFGEWMAEIIRTLRGHHEPQEEIVFHRMVERLRADSANPVMIELGSFWTYYGLWFLKALPDARLVALEPDPGYRRVGVHNAALNDLTDRVAFVAAAVGGDPGATIDFAAESDGQSYPVVLHDLESLMREQSLTRVDLVLADIQGHETTLLERAKPQLEAGAVRFMLISTHHHSISGDVLTHQKALAMVTDAGGHVIVEHTPAESFSGDGLIAISFDPRDKDFTIELNYTRSKDSLFGEFEPELAATQSALAATVTQSMAAQRAHAESAAEAAESHERAHSLAVELARVNAELSKVTRERDALQTRAGSALTLTSRLRHRFHRG